MITVTDANFKEVLASNPTILVDFWAEWCGPCKKMEPILSEIHSENTVVVGKYNVDENGDNTVQYSVRSIPTMILFKDGEPVKSITGAKPKHILLKELADYTN